MKLKRGEPLIQKQDSNHIIANITIWKIWRNNVLFLILNRKNQLLIDEAEERKAPPYKNKLPIILKPTTESGKSKETISYVLYSYSYFRTVQYRRLIDHPNQ